MNKAVSWSIDLSEARVLLLNDDGIDAPGFKILKSIAEEISNEIWVFAPKNDKSGAGRSITDRKSTRLNSSHSQQSRMPSSA